MKITVMANEEQQEEWLSKGNKANIELIWNDADAEADVYFDLLFEQKGSSFNNITNKPVFVNAVITTCKELPDNYLRLNAWSGFLKRSITEVACTRHQAIVKKVMNMLGWNYQLTTDQPGFIAARIIAMVINEAYFALQDNISSKEEIDTAMKLGTNYPLGPFEWCNKIGLPRIYLLLNTLSQTDNRYTPSEKLSEELKSIA